MAKTVLFVHGTGVREDGYKASLEVVRKQLKEHAPGVGVAECRWGEHVGARLSRDGASIPTYGESRGIGATQSDELQALWNLLLQDPSFELGLLSSAAGKPPGGPNAPNAAKPSKELTDAFLALGKSKDLKQALVPLGLTKLVPAAMKMVQASPGFKLAGASPLAGQPPHRDALARALVASLARLALDIGAPVPDAAGRDELVKTVQNLIAPDTRGLFSFVTAPFKGLAESIATWQIRRKRTSLTDATYPAAGDILVYQARGESIRQFIRGELDKLKDDSVFILAHSLGGIASFETLIEQRPLQVKGLVTFGSQVPFFYEIGALRTLPGADEKLPLDFPSWINFYDLNDPLSYVGEGIFGQDRMSDHKVVSGESFPASHSAYLHSRAFWQHVSSFIAQHA